jgi:hypothetical protein
MSRGILASREKVLIRCTYFLYDVHISYLMNFMFCTYVDRHFLYQKFHKRLIFVYFKNLALRGCALWIKGKHMIVQDFNGVTFL